jgi:hypothetical protein
VTGIKDFFIAALSSALELGIATPDDVIEFATSEVLAAHLPRPLWARLLTACIGAPRVDAQLVVDTVGVANLCEHVPSPIIWSCLAKVGARSLGGDVPAKPRAATAPPAPPRASSPALAIATPPPPVEKVATAPSAPARGPSIPSFTTGATSTVVAPPPTSGFETDDDGPNTAVNQRARTPTGGRFRGSNTGIGRLANTTRRPQASAEPPPTPARRGQTEAGETAFDVETEVGRESDDWKATLAVDVDDDQLVDWTTTEETAARDDVPRKR